jgi:hypothetical protein
LKLVTKFLVSLVATGIALTASARDYHHLVVEGYRWVKIDRPLTEFVKVGEWDSRDPKDRY